MAYFKGLYIFAAICHMYNTLPECRGDECPASVFCELQERLN